jgi:hypothetical protein
MTGSKRAAVVAFGLLIVVAFLAFRRAVDEAPSALPSRVAVPEEEPRERLAPPGIPEPREQPALPAALRELAVSVRDERDQAVTGASVSRVQDGREQALGATDAAGDLTLPHVAGAQLVARHAGFSAGTALVGETDERVTLTLLSHGTIAGRVQLASGLAPEGSIRVLASPHGRPLECAAIRARSVAFADTDGAGYFRITGLDRRVAFRVAGVGSGYLVDPHPDVEPSDAEILLTALPLYGVRLVMRDAAGGPLHGSPDLFAQFGGSVKCLDSTAKLAKILPEELELAGIGGAGCSEQESRDVMVVVFSGASEVDRVGPIAVDMTLPGYRPVEESVWAPRITASLPEHTLALERLCDDWGSVEVTFRGIELDIACDVTIQLRGQAPSARYALRVPRLSSQPYTVTGVPADGYLVSVETSGGLFRHPPRSSGREEWLQVYPGETARLAIDLAGRTTLACELLDEVGLPLSGRVIFRLMTASNAVYHVEFDQAPYTLVGIPPGEYTVSAMLGSGAVWPGQEPYRKLVHIEGGGVTPLVLTR